LREGKAVLPGLLENCPGVLEFILPEELPLGCAEPNRLGTVRLLFAATGSQVASGTNVPYPVSLFKRLTGDEKIKEFLDFYLH
jgi:hypothetical protein